MASEIVKVEDSGVKLALGQFALSLEQRSSLLKAIAAGQLVSIRRTFSEQGSPSGSWAPLAPSTVRNKSSKASGGRKILILSGRLLNSIQSRETEQGVEIGTNLVYARVQQEGSADRGAGAGPQARIEGRSADVPEFTRHYLRPLGTGMRAIADKRGRATVVRTRYQGPQHQKASQVKAHTRFQNIPARPYLVLRPEDPERIEGQVVAFVGGAARKAGLNVAGGAS